MVQERRGPCCNWYPTFIALNQLAVKITRRSLFFGCICIISSTCTCLSIWPGMGPREWAFYQICNNVGCACAGNTGNVSRHQLQKKPLVSTPCINHGTCVTHVPWCMSGSLTRGGGKTFPAFPAHAQPAILRIWQDAHKLRSPHTKGQLHGKCFHLMTPSWKGMPILLCH